jgi:radical SAM protein with 4Fe4S-binding SPASM domain
MTAADRVLDLTLHNLPAFLADAVDRDSAREELAATCATIHTADAPRIYQVETTSRCNLRCPFCPRTTDLLAHHRRDLDAEMPLERFEHILDQMPQLRSLELFHFGEPFMQHNLSEYVAACGRRGIYSVIASNLLPATPRKIDEVFAAGLNFLVLDVDSLDARKYAEARVGGNLEILRHRVRYILDHPARPYCAVQTILLDGSPAYCMVDLMAWCGARSEPDELRYKFLDSFRGEAADKGGLAPTDLCREPFYGFSVHVNGNVVPCDRDWAGENVMGNLFDDSVAAIWKGERFERFRAMMRSPEKPAMCRKCPEGRLVNLRSQPHIQVNCFRGAEVEHE